MTTRSDLMRGRNESDLKAMIGAMQSNRKITTMLACALILLAAGLVIYPCLIVSLNKCTTREECKVTSTSIIETVTSHAATPMEPAATSLTYPSTTVAALTAAATTNANILITTIKPCPGDITYKRWMGVCLKMFTIVNLIPGPARVRSPVNMSSSCTTTSTAANYPAMVDSIQTNNLVQNFIDSIIQSGTYYVNVAFTNGDWTTNAGMERAAVLLLFDDGEPTFTTNAFLTMRFRGMGLLKAKANNLLTTPDHAFLICQLDPAV